MIPIFQVVAPWLPQGATQAEAPTVRPPIPGLPDKAPVDLAPRAPVQAVHAPELEEAAALSLLTPYQAKQADLDFAFGERALAHLDELRARSAKEAGMLGFMPTWAVRATLPYQQPKDNPPAWSRKSGDFTFVVQPGFESVVTQSIDAKGRPVVTESLVSIGYPFGVYPRLLLAYVVTEIVRTRQREISFGRQFQLFLKDSGRDLSGGGPRGSGTLLKQQAKRLFSASFSVTRGTIDASWVNQGFRLFDEACIATLLNSKQDIWTARLQVSEVFYESVMKEGRVPFDLRTLNLLSDSAMAMDIYLWLTHRAISLHRNTEIPWSYLMNQFGSEAKSQGKFKQAFLANLRKVERLYVEVNGRYSADRHGLTLYPGIKPAIPPKTAL